MPKPVEFPPIARSRPPRGHILLVEPLGGSESAPVRPSLSVRALEAEGHTLSLAATGKEALGIVRRGSVDLVLAESQTPDLDTADLITCVHQDDADVPVIILTDTGDIDTAVACIRQGAYDYLPRPLNLRNLLTAVDNALEQRRLRGDVRVLRKHAIARDSFGELIGRSEAMQTVFRRIAKIAPHDSTVLILGESGTGKEMVAREVHRRSPVSGGPFVAVNCGGVPGDLIESELFGHERGTFTGAAAAHDGLFRAAAGGTLFLDEIGAMPLPQQSSLLRALEKKEIRRVGGTRTFRVNVRVIAATSTDLDQAMESGNFRQDLYYRLSRAIIHLPALRERVEDIPVLCSHFIARHSASHGRFPRRLTTLALDVLCNRVWAGNVRELENAIEQAMMFSQGDTIRPADLPFHKDESRATEPQSLDDIMREYIKSVLARTAGNKLKAARILGIPRPTLYHRMRKLGLKMD